jgi:ribosomal protein S18 acetylase RimI-like enzyme
VPRITVATASPADLDVVMAIWTAANATRRRPAGPVRAARVRHKLGTGELVLLAHYGERPAGMALAETFVDSGTPDPSTGHISMVFVDPAVWGSGVGNRLLRDLQTRWPRLSVWTRLDNRRARRLYVGAGFTDSGNRSTLQDGDEIMQLVWSSPSD